jgi:CRP-like cAMP-binding protein
MLARMDDDLCVAHVPIFSRLSRAQQMQVAEVARPVSARPGEVLYHQGGAPAPLIVVHRGLVKLVRVSPDGRERVLQVMEPGDFVGEASLLSGGRPDHSAVAVADAQLCVFRPEAFAGLLGSHPQVGFAMMGALSRRLASAQELLEQVSSREVGARVADYLLGLEAHRDADDIVAQLPLPKKDIASLLGTTPESFSRALTRLVEADVIALEGTRKVVITDVDALSELAAS